MESPVPLELAFLSAALKGDIPSLKRVVAELVFRIGEGPGKTVCATFKSPDGHSALHMAAGEGRAAMCRFLVEELNFDVNCVNPEGETPLFSAALGGHGPTTIRLIQNGADVSRSNHKGFTPMHYAAAKGSKEIVSRLILEGADMHAISERGTPLHSAAYCGHVDVLKHLLDLKADPNSISPLYMSPLMLAMLGESIECMDLLLKAGADPNEDCSRSQVTPLCFAVTKQYGVEMIRLLLNAGADPNKTDPTGKAALEEAAEIGRREVVQLLFPVTSCIPCYPDWTINGVMKYVRSKKATELRISKMEELNVLAKARGKKAFESKNYLDAMYWYTQAVDGDPTDVKSLSNRSFCYTLMNDGTPALADAKTCVKLAPGWAKAHYREGAAWKVLNDYKKAVEAFSRALALEPGNKEIESAHREALAECNKGSH